MLSAGRFLLSTRALGSSYHYRTGKFSIFCGVSGYGHPLYSNPNQTKTKIDSGGLVHISKRYESTGGYYDGSLFKYLSECTPTEYMKSFFVQIHDSSGLPWWATVVISSIFLRGCLTLPFAIYQNFIIAKVENLSLVVMPEVAKEVKKEVAMKAKQENWTDKQTFVSYQRAMTKRWDELVVIENCHPMKSAVLLWIQLPLWIFVTSALRNLVYMLPNHSTDAEIIYLQLATGGFLWIPNLTLPDGLLILPVILGATNLLNIEMQAVRRLTKSSKMQKYAVNFFRAFSIALIPISATVPSVLCLYWTTSSVLGLCQNLLLMSNKFRSFCHIPDTPTTLEHPYLQLWADLKNVGKKSDNKKS